MRIPVLLNDKAKELLDSLDPPSTADPCISAYQTNNGAGELLDLSSFQVLARDLALLREKCNDDTKLFDSAACVLVHQALPTAPEALSDDGFWRWLALGPLRSITTWRFPPGKDRVDESGTIILGRYNRQNLVIPKLSGPEWA